MSLIKHTVCTTIYHICDLKDVCGKGNNPAPAARERGPKSDKKYRNIGISPIFSILSGIGIGDL